jgi:hypothetical protein
MQAESANAGQELSAEHVNDAGGAKAGLHYYLAAVVIGHFTDDGGIFAIAIPLHPV